MKQRDNGFLSKENIDHNSEGFDYITELHEYLWRFVRVVNPGASGNLNELLDDAINKAENIEDTTKSAYEPGTVGYWLNKMNEPERSLAFENTSPEKLTETITGNESYAIKYALDSAFLWESTAEKGQGWKFWSYVCIEKELAAKTAKELPFFKTSFKDAVLKVV